MAPLDLTLVLLPMAVATMANDVVPLDTALDSNNQLQDYGHAVIEELPALNHSDLEEDPLFAEVWEEDVDKWLKLQFSEFPLLRFRSTRTYTYSNFSFEELQGGSETRATGGTSGCSFHLGGLLLATTALAVATGML